MYSVGEARKRLPKDYVDYLYEHFSSKKADSILQAAARPLPSSLRCNTLKSDIHTLLGSMQAAGLKPTRVPWYSQALLFPAPVDKKLLQHPSCAAGAFYLQSLSSMLPPLFLDPQPASSVLDLCAAPGGKTSQMAALMANTGSITAVEVDSIRRQRLEFNLTRLGVINTTIQGFDGTRVGGRAPDVFDFVLVDAPCSGEGRFRIQEPQTYRHWRWSFVHKVAKLQRRLLLSGIEALKPGGRLVYSTCTLNHWENEAVLQQVLESRPEVRTLPLSLPGLKMATASAAGPNEADNAQIRRARRIFPSPAQEGFFCCLMTKS